MPKASKLLAAVIVVVLVWAATYAVDWNGLTEWVQGTPLAQDAKGIVLGIKEAVVSALAFVAGWLGRGE